MKNITKETKNELLCINIADRLKKEGVYAMVHNMNIIIQDECFTISDKTEKIINSYDGYILPASLGEDAIVAFIIYINNSKKEKIVEDKAVEFVRAVGIQPNLKGYHFLVSAICIGVNSQEMIFPLSSKLYPKVAIEYNVDVRCVERNIRTAIDLAYHNDSRQLRKFFTYQGNKPYISEIIALAVDMIKHDAL